MKNVVKLDEKRGKTLYPILMMSGQVWPWSRRTKAQRLYPLRPIRTLRGSPWGYPDISLYGTVRRAVKKNTRYYRVVSKDHTV